MFVAPEVDTKYVTLVSKLTEYFNLFRNEMWFMNDVYFKADSS